MNLCILHVACGVISLNCKPDSVPSFLKHFSGSPLSSGYRIIFSVERIRPFATWTWFTATFLYCNIMLLFQDLAHSWNFFSYSSFWPTPSVSSGFNLECSRELTFLRSPKAPLPPRAYSGILLKYFYSTCWLFALYLDPVFVWNFLSRAWAGRKASLSYAPLGTHVHSCIPRNITGLSNYILNEWTNISDFLIT